MTSSVLRSAYGRLPVFLQDATFSVAGALRARQRYGTEFRSRLTEFLQSEWWDTARIAEYQLLALNSMFRDAVRYSPLYQGKYAGLRLLSQPFRHLDELKELPILRKEEVAGNPDALRPSTLEGKLVSGLTSGTTGTPLPVRLTPSAVQAQWAIWWRFRARFGISPGDRFLTVGARVPVPADQREPPYWRWDWANNRCYLSSYHLQPEHLPAVAKFIAETPFQFLTGYPSALVLVAGHMLEHGIRLRHRLKAVLTGSDALLPNFERCIGDAFECPVSDQYGMAEFAGNLSRCPAGHYHEDFECGIVELEPLPGFSDGRGKLILTGLLNPAMPLVRYDIGDSAVPLPYACPCGRKSRAFSAIHGRVEDYILARDGRRIIGMNQVLEYGGAMREAQIRQTAEDRLAVLYVPRSSEQDVDRDAILRELRLRGIGDQYSVEFRRVQAVPREANGKYRAVVCEISERGRPETWQAEPVGTGS